MRQIGTFTDADAARLFADYLLTKSIDTRLDQETEGWILWARDEDKLTEAKGALAEYQANPADERFRQAGKEAEELRRRSEQAETEPAPEEIRPIDNGRIPRWTMAFIAISAAVGLATNFGGYGLGSHRLNVTAPPDDIVKALTITSLDFTTESGVSVIHWKGLDDIQHGQLWRLVTPIFLHFGFVHFLFNMLAFAYFGARIEERRGSRIFLLLVLGSAIPSNLVQYYLGGTTWDWQQGFSVRPYPFFGGMSGVCYALFGYVWMKAIREPELGLTMQYVTWATMFAWFWICWTGAIGPVGNFAHGVGLLVGMLIGVAPVVWRQVWRDREG